MVNIRFAFVIILSPLLTSAVRFPQALRDPAAQEGAVCALFGPPRKSDNVQPDLTSGMCAQSGLARGPTVTEEARPTRRPSAGSPRWLFPPLAFRTQNLRTYVADLHVWKGDGGGGVLGDNRRVSTSFILFHSCCPLVVRADAIRGGPIFDFRFCRWILFGEASALRFRYWTKRPLNCFRSMHVYESFYAHLQDYYSRVVSPCHTIMFQWRDICIIKLNCVTVYFNITSRMVSLNCKCVCLAEKLILIFISFDSAFLTNRVASQSISRI